MSTQFVVPEEQAVTDLLSIILGDGLKVTRDEPRDASEMYTATYVDDNDVLVAAGASDLPFVFYSGAALSMIPAGAANDMMKEGPAEGNIADNYYEVMNICSRLLMTEKDEVHLRLAKTFAPPAASGEIAALNDAVQVGFKLEIPQYGEGFVQFFIK